MKTTNLIRIVCIASFAAVAMAGLCMQPVTSGATASLSEDFLTLARDAQPLAKSAPVLKDWQYTRARPPKCPFF